MREILNREEVRSVAEQILGHLPQPYRMMVQRVEIVLRHSETAMLDFRLRAGERLFARQVMLTSEKLEDDLLDFNLQQVADLLQRDVKKYSQQQWNTGMVDMVFHDEQ